MYLWGNSETEKKSINSESLLPIRRARHSSLQILLAPTIMQQVTMEMHRRPRVKRWFVLSDCNHNCNGSAASIPMSTRRKIRSALLYLLQVYRQTDRQTERLYSKRTSRIKYNFFTQLLWLERYKMWPIRIQTPFTYNAKQRKCDVAPLFLDNLCTTH